MNEAVRFSVDHGPATIHPIAACVGYFILLCAWLVLAGQGVRALIGLRAATEPDRRWARRIAALTAAAVGARVAIAPFTPEIRWRILFAYDPQWMLLVPWSERPPLGMEDVQKYGLGWPALARLLVGLFGYSDLVPFWGNLVIGGCCVAPMVGLVREVGGSDSAALWAGFCIAVTPLLVWFSGTDGPFPPEAFFSLLTLWATARFARTHDTRLLVTAVCSVVSAAQMRVESVMTGVAAVLLAVALARQFPWRRAGPWVAAASASALLIPHAILVHAQLWKELGDRYGEGSVRPLPFAFENYLVTNPTMQSWALIAAAPIGLLFGRVSWRVRLWAAVMLWSAAATIPDVAPTETAFSVARYQLRSLPYAALLAGLGADALGSVRLPGGAGSLVGRIVAAGFALAALFGLRLGATVSVLKTEYDFFRAHLDAVPSACAVMTWRSQGDTTLFVPLHLSRLRGDDHRWLDIARDEVPEEGCVWYYRSGGCAENYRRTRGGEPQHPVCTTFEASHILRPVAERALPADPVGPMGRRDQLEGLPIPVGFFEVVRP